MIYEHILGAILLLVGAFFTSFILDLEMNKLYLIGSIGLFLVGLFIILTIRWEIIM